MLFSESTVTKPSNHCIYEKQLICFPILSHHLLYAESVQSLSSSDAHLTREWVLQESIGSHELGSESRMSKPKQKKAEYGMTVVTS